MYSYLLPCIVLMAAVAYFHGSFPGQYSCRDSGGMRALHSLPSHYGMLTALCCAIPALLVFMGWWIVEERVITAIVTRSLPAELQQLSANELSLVLNEMKNVAFGGFSSANTTPSHPGRRPSCISQPSAGPEIWSQSPPSSAASFPRILAYR